MNILGLNAFHGDAAACLVVDGELLAAAEEERFRRIKHWAGFPAQAIRYCLTQAGLDLTQIDRVAVNSAPGANLARKLRYTLTHVPSITLVAEKLRNRRLRSSVVQLLSQAFDNQPCDSRVHRIEHHAAHLASAYYPSPFDTATTVSVDGFGDFSSAAWGTASGTGLRVAGHVHFPHSLGVLYQAVTQYLGFPNYGDEYKVMGLAPYGEPVHLSAMRRLLTLRADGTFALNLRFFRHHRHAIGYQWEGCAPQVGRLYSEQLVGLLGPARAPDEGLEQRHRDIARSLQALYEEAFFHLLNQAYARHRCENLALAGGCAMNSVANGRILANTPYRRIYVQPAAGDAGGAIGAAFTVWHRLSRTTGRFPMNHAYWGPSFGAAEIRSLLRDESTALQDAHCRIELIDDESELCERIAAKIAEGKVIGWFQGRMEWGPRALGNRSILCDPRRSDMKDILNAKIKRRESFRPFAPAILREAVAEWFETDDDVPFMMKVYPIRRERRSQIPAVTHVDGSGRLQTVHAQTNARFHRLIQTFGARTGVPILLNTSFNENEPIVCQPREALECFLRTRMDILALGNYVIERTHHS